MFASADDNDQNKSKDKTRSSGRKIDIIWAMRPLKLEFSISKISGPPNCKQHTHYAEPMIVL